MVRLMLMYYVDFIAFMENPEKSFEHTLSRKQQYQPLISPIYNNVKKEK